jgi:hypothetical protein
MSDQKERSAINMSLCRIVPGSEIEEGAIVDADCLMW